MTTEQPKTAIEAPSATKPSASSAPAPESPPDLEARVGTRKQELIAKLVELKASTQPGATEAGDKIKARLSELNHIVKEGVVDGWANIGDTARTKLDSWLAR